MASKTGKLFISFSRLFTVLPNAMRANKKMRKLFALALSALWYVPHFLTLLMRKAVASSYAAAPGKPDQKENEKMEEATYSMHPGLIPVVTRLYFCTTFVFFKHSLVYYL